MVPVARVQNRLIKWRSPETGFRHMWLSLSITILSRSCIVYQPVKNVHPFQNNFNAQSIAPRLTALAPNPLRNKTHAHKN